MAFRFWKRKPNPRDNLIEVLGDAKLPSFPQLVLEVLADLRNPEVPVQVVAQKLESDPGLSLRLLAMANSAAFGSRRKIPDVKRAVIYLGRHDVEALVLSAGAMESMPRRGVQGFQPGRFWRAGIRRAAIAREIASRLHPTSASLSFTASLLQDMAIPLLAHRRTQDYGPLLEHWHQEAGDLAALEVMELGWNHAEVAGWLCEHWEIPDTLGKAIEGHHSPDAEDDAVPPAVRLVGLLGEGDSSDEAEVLVETAKQSFALTPDQAIEAIEQGTEQAEQLAQILGS
jgi:HD-like signal output (HDOD) protein